MSAIPADAASLLSETGWLSRTPKDFCNALLDACLCYPTRSGQAITHGGEKTGGVFGIVAGTAGVYSAVGWSEGPLIHIAGPTYWFGLFPITNGAPRIISVTARTPCLVVQVPQAALQTLLDRKPEMWRWLNLLALESDTLACQAP